MVISDGILAVPRNRNFQYSVPNPSAEEKTTRNSVPWNKNRSKFSEFPSEPFSGRENNSEITLWGAIRKRWAGEYHQEPSCPFFKPSVSWNKNGSKLSEFRSEPFRGKKKTRNKTRQQKISKIVAEKTTSWGTDLRVHTECNRRFLAYIPSWWKI